LGVFCALHPAAATSATMQARVSRIRDKPTTFR
jgi:hypothetical protein